jgi:hypothetical protein
MKIDSQQLRKNPNENRNLNLSPNTMSLNLLTKKLRSSDAASDVRKSWPSPVLRLLCCFMR